MSELVVIAYPDEHRAAEAYTTLRRKVHPDPLFNINTPITLYITKDHNNKIMIHRNQHTKPTNAINTTKLLLKLVYTLPLADTITKIRTKLLITHKTNLNLNNKFV